jgi:hypothetical protein
MLMHLCVCIVSVAPIRKEPSHKSEIVTQLLFLESATFLEEQGDFVRIKCTYDGYEGWCQVGQLSIVDSLEPNVGWHLKAINNVAINQNNILASIGTPWFNKPLHINNYIAECAGEESNGNLQFAEENIVALTAKYIGAPYLWGGKSIFGIDCSGFSQQVFKMMGKYLPRDAYQQAELGNNIGFLEEASCGDLAFFDDENGKITHVGILLNSHSIIHASSYVKIDKIDSMGIISSLTNKRTHKLRLIKSFK